MPSLTKLEAHRLTKEAAMLLHFRGKGDAERLVEISQQLADHWLDRKEPAIGAYYLELKRDALLELGRKPEAKRTQSFLVQKLADWTV